MIWFHERTPDGWSILDENRLLVAIVPDAAHEREADANTIISAAGTAERHERLIDALWLIRTAIETDIESLRGKIAELVGTIQIDAHLLHAQYAARGADVISSVVIETHAAELGRAQSELDRNRVALRRLERAMEAGS